MMSAVEIQLYGRVLSPECYLAQVLLCEQRMDYVPHFYEPEAISSDIFRVSPYGILPLLVRGKKVWIGRDAVVDWLFTQPEHDKIALLLPKHEEQRAMVRYWCQLYHQKFAVDVEAPLFHEKIVTLFTCQTPEASVIITARRNLHNSYLPYLEHLFQDQAYLVGNDLSLADLTVAVYLGEIPWRKFPQTAIWYQRMKSRRSFSGLLSLRLPKRPPSNHFAVLDADE